jgi:hypothetical protein
MPLAISRNSFAPFTCLSNLSSDAFTPTAISSFEAAKESVAAKAKSNAKQIVNPTTLDTPLAFIPYLLHHMIFGSPRGPLRAALDLSALYFFFSTLK